jgi:arsenate reductase
MSIRSLKFLPALVESLHKASETPISSDRKSELEVLIRYIQAKVDLGEEVNLNFICTHNSRRSQLCQIWAKTAAAYHGIPANCYSGGVEVTAFNSRAVDSLRRSGFRISPSDNRDNPHYSVAYAESSEPLLAFSKRFDDPVNQATHFAAVMTCDHADENCPFIPGAEQRISLQYEDPKFHDDTPLEAEKYDERSQQIASEMVYVFSEIEV